MRRTVLALLFCVLCLAGASVSVAPAGAQGGRQYVSGTVVGFGGRAVARSRPFQVIINRYTTEGEVRTLNEALRSGGQDRLLDELNRLDAGRITFGSGVGVPANAIIRTPTPEGGTRLQVLFERNLNLFELRYGTRSSDYRFGYAEIFLDRRGRGEGTLIPAARIRLLDGNTWEVEDFGVYPARLMGVRTSGSVPAR